MSEFEDIQRLIRLKRFETPGEDFVEDFVSQFRERQRSEMLRQSARGLLWERVTTYFEHLISPKWATAAATASVCLLGSWAGVTLTSGGQSGPLQIAALSTSAALPQGVQTKPQLAVESPLIKEVESAPVAIENSLLSNHFEIDGPQQPELAGLTGAATPGLGFFPVSDFGR
jgi:hypothetical protein